MCGALDSDPELLEKHEAQHRFMRQWIAGKMSAVLNHRGGYHKIRTSAPVCIDCKDESREVAAKNRCQRCYQRWKHKTKVAEIKGT